MFPSHKLSAALRPLPVANILRLLLLGVLFILVPHRTEAAGTLIPAPARVDMVYDSTRDTVYITNGSSVLRYQIGSNSFLAPFDLGGSLSGIDLSPDGNTLAVADRQRSATEVWIHLVDLQTGLSSKVTFPRAYSEGGTFTVAFGNDGAIAVTSIFEGSGWVPLRRYNPGTGATNVVASSVRHQTMLTASADASVIGFAESDSSGGPFGRYRVADGNLLRKSGFGDGTGWSNYEMGVSRNGTQFAVPTYGGTYIYDAELRRINLVGQYAGPQPVGVVYHPAEDVVYFAWAGSTEVRAFDTNSFTQVAGYDFEYGFTSPGNHAFVHGRLKISRDGSLLLATVNGGVRFQRLYAPLAADAQAVVLDEDSSASLTLTGSVGNGGALNYSIATPPAHGQLSGSGANLIYTPDADYSGTDSFTFKTSYGAASQLATVSITVNPVNDAPVADSKTLTTTEDNGTTVNMTGSDVDGDALNYIIVNPPAHGTLSGVSFYGLVYTPAADYSGEDSFTFKTNDGALDSNPATVSITVEAVNDAPSANGQAVSTGEDTGTAITLSGSDIENNALSYVVVSAPSHGTLSGTGQNLFYTPAANYNGSDSFTFKVSDGAAESSVATVNISVAAVNDAPVALADSATVLRNSVTSMPVLVNDQDVDNDGLTVVSVTQGTQGGTVSINSGGAGVTFKPRFNFTGLETFTYRISDGKGGFSTATVTVNVIKK